MAVHTDSFRLGKLIPTKCDVKPVSLAPVLFKALSHLFLAIPQRFGHVATRLEALF